MGARLALGLDMPTPFSSEAPRSEQTAIVQGIYDSLKTRCTSVGITGMADWYVSDGVTQVINFLALYGMDPHNVFAHSPLSGMSRASLGSIVRSARSLIHSAILPKPHPSEHIEDWSGTYNPQAYTYSRESWFCRPDYTEFANISDFLYYATGTTSSWLPEHDLVSSYAAIDQIRMCVEALKYAKVYMACSVNSAQTKSRRIWKNVPTRIPNLDCWSAMCAVTTNYTNTAGDPDVWETITSNQSIYGYLLDYTANEGYNQSNQCGLSTGLSISGSWVAAQVPFTCSKLGVTLDIRRKNLDLPLNWILGQLIVDENGEQVTYPACYGNVRDAVVDATSFVYPPVREDYAYSETPAPYTWMTSTPPGSARKGTRSVIHAVFNTTMQSEGNTVTAGMELDSQSSYPFTVYDTIPQENGYSLVIEPNLSFMEFHADLTPYV